MSTEQLTDQDLIDLLSARLCRAEEAARQVMHEVTDWGHSIGCIVPGDYDPIDSFAHGELEMAIGRLSAEVDAFKVRMVEVYRLREALRDLESQSGIKRTTPPGFDLPWNTEEPLASREGAYRNGPRRVK